MATLEGRRARAFELGLKSPQLASNRELFATSLLSLNDRFVENQSITDVIEEARGIVQSRSLGDARGLRQDRQDAIQQTQAQPTGDDLADLFGLASQAPPPARQAVETAKETAEGFGLDGGQLVTGLVVAVVSAILVAVITMVRRD